MKSPLLDAFKSLNEVDDAIVAREKKVLGEGLKFKKDKDVIETSGKSIESTFTGYNLYEGLDDESLYEEENATTKETWTAVFDHFSPEWVCIINDYDTFPGDWESFEITPIEEGKKSLIANNDEDGYEVVSNITDAEWLDILKKAYSEYRADVEENDGEFSGGSLEDLFGIGIEDGIESEEEFIEYVNDYIEESEVDNDSAYQFRWYDSDSVQSWKDFFDDEDEYDDDEEYDNEEQEESLEEGMLNEKLPKDLSQAYKRLKDASRVEWTGANRRGARTDYEAAEYKVITPEEALEAKKEGRAQDLRVLLDGEVIAFREDGYPLTGVELSWGDDRRYVKKSGEKVSNTKLMPFSHVINIADKIYLTDEQAHKFPSGSWVDGKWVNDSPIDQERAQKRADLIADTGEHRKKERSYGSVDYYERKVKSEKERVENINKSLADLEAKWEAGDISKNSYESEKKSLQGYLNTAEENIKYYRDNAFRAKGEISNARAKARNALSAKVLQSNMDKFRELKYALNNAMSRLNYLKQSGGLSSYSLKGGSYEEKVKKMDELKNKIKELNAQLSRLESEATDELKKSNEEQNAKAFKDAEDKVNSIKAEVNSLLRKVTPAEANESLNERKEEEISFEDDIDDIWGSDRKKGKKDDYGMEYRFNVYIETEDVEDCIGSYADENKAIEFAKKYAKAPYAKRTYVIYFPDGDPDDHGYPDTPHGYEAFSVIWSSDEDDTQTESLTEGVINLRDHEEIEKAIEERENVKEEAPIEQVVDPNATIVDELEKSYVGKAILECTKCLGHHYMDPKELEVSEEKTAEGDKIYNLDFECPTCHAKEGFLLVGQVAELKGDEEEKPEKENNEPEILGDEDKVEEQPEEPVEVPTLETSEEEVKEEETFGESLTDFDEASFDSHMTKYLTEVYSNVESYTSTEGSNTDDGIIIEGLIKFKSGKTKPTIFKLSLENGKMSGLNESFSSDSNIYTIEGRIENNNFITENIIYKYNIDGELVEGYTGEVCPECGKSPCECLKESESWSDQEIVDMLVANGSCATKKEAQSRVKRMNDETKAVLCKAFKKQAQDNLNDL